MKKLFKYIFAAYLGTTSIYGFAFLSCLVFPLYIQDAILDFLCVNYPVLSFVLTALIGVIVAKFNERV